MSERELLILRHAKSAWDTDAGTDFERPLAKRGRRDAPRMGEWLLEQGLVPDLIVSSSASRALETARLAAEAMGLADGEIREEERIYAAGLGTLLEVLGACPADARRVMIVGHNPGFESLVAYLAGPDSSLAYGAKLLPTAAVAHFGMPRVWRDLPPGAGELESYMKPKMLPA